jgi:Helix-turn-helix domain
LHGIVLLYHSIISDDRKRFGIIEYTCKGLFYGYPRASKCKNIFIMNLNNLLESGNNITVSVSLVDLKEFAAVLIDNTKKELELVVISDKAETYPSPKQVCEILDVDLSTLWRWNKRGYLCSSEVGGKRRYKMSEVKAILNGGGIRK